MKTPEGVASKDNKRELTYTQMYKKVRGHMLGSSER